MRHSSSTCDEAAPVDDDAGALQTELVGVRPATDADDDGVDLEVLGGPPPAGSKCTVVPPLSFGVWPLTLTDVRMSICFFLKLRTTTLATSVSRPGRIFGRPSRIVTFEPRSANVLANSQPMAPPPMTIIRSGTRSSISTSSLVMIGPPGSKPGMVRGTEPAARTTASPVSVDDEPSG